MLQIATKNKVIEPELSYKVVGIAYKVYKELGFGYPEKYCQLAFEEELKESALVYKREEILDLYYKGKKIGNYRLDFVIENKIVVEIKVGKYFHNKDFSQIKAYLKKTGLKLGLLILFGSNGVEFKRVLTSSK